MQQQHDLVIPEGYQVVVRQGRDGAQVMSLQKTSGRTFYAEGKTAGYVLGAALQHQTLAKVRMPPAWTRVWQALLAIQSRDVPGYVRITHEELAVEFGIPLGQVADPMRYFAHILWLRKVRNGLYQLNPFLVYRGVSGAQEIHQMEWREATADKIVTIPPPGHPYWWMKERETLKRPQLALVMIESGAPTATISASDNASAASGVEQLSQTATRPVSEETGKMLWAAGTNADKIRVARRILGDGQTTAGKVEDLLQLHGIHVPKNTIISTLKRDRKAEREAGAS